MARQSGPELINAQAYLDSAGVALTIAEDGRGETIFIQDDGGPRDFQVMRRAPAAPDSGHRVIAR
jgi:hypothetical protein